MMVSAVTATARTRKARPKTVAARASSFFIVAAATSFQSDQRPDALLPSFGAAGIDLVAGLRPGRVGDLAHRGLDDLEIGRNDRHGRQAEFLAGGARVLA